MTDPRAGWADRGAAYAASEVHRLGPSLPKVAALLRPRREDRIVDVGTGTGHTAAYLARWSDHVTGVDPEPDMLGAARHAYGDLPGLAFAHGAGEALPFPDNAFDGAVARHTLHHHVDVEATLREVHRVLRPGGRLVLVDETAPDPEHAAWLERLERLRDPSHVATRALGAWEDLLRRAGFAWIVGDARTRYVLDVASWLDRMDASAATRKHVHMILREATPPVREAFEITWSGGEPSCFALPMNIVLVVKEES